MNHVRRFVCLALFLLAALFIGAAAAETRVELLTPDVRVGEKAMLRVSHDRVNRFSYVLMFDSKTLGSADDVDETKLSFWPEEEGTYLLRVMPEGAIEDTIHYTFTVLPRDESAGSGFQLYGQKDGRWAHTQYGRSTLEFSGCAIFALNHALQRLGYAGEEIDPAVLAQRYKRFLGVTGTRNGSLINQAAKDFGFETNNTLFTTVSALQKRFRRGAVFSFGIVDHHIALADGMSEDGKMCHIVDSSPSSTFRHLEGNVTPSYYDETTGTYVPAERPTDIPGVGFSLISLDYDGAEYWLPLSYLAKRGGRLIQGK